MCCVLHFRRLKAGLLCSPPAWASWVSSMWVCSTVLSTLHVFVMFLPDSHGDSFYVGIVLVTEFTFAESRIGITGLRSFTNCWEDSFCAGQQFPSWNHWSWMESSFLGIPLRDAHVSGSAGMSAALLQLCPVFDSDRSALHQTPALSSFLEISCISRSVAFFRENREVQSVFRACVGCVLCLLR